MSTTKICTQCGTEYDLKQKFCPADGSPLRLQSADDPLIGQMVAERYQILSLIGEGGMGRVYLAEHVRMGRKSAVKVINPALAATDDAIARFNREAANACKINHPNVAQVYDFGEMADGTLYLAMEYIDGETLDSVVARDGRLPAVRAAHITKQVADALFAAHHLGIVHRDLKPENVMVARHLDGSDWVKVVDFGIAKTLQRDGGESQTVTTAGVTLGTPEYMSPEQLAGERLDHRTDIYSLGLVLFNMLTGELPYPKVTSKETLVRRLTSRPRTLAETRPGIVWPVALQQALDRALAPEIADRFDSVAEFGRAVVRAVEAGSDAPATAAVVASAPSPTVAPDAITENDARLERPIAHRRALPWAVGTAATLAAVLVVATLSSRQKRAMIAEDSVFVPEQVAAPATAAPLPPAVPHPALPSQTPGRVATTAAPSPRATASGRASATASASRFSESLSDSIRRIVGNIPLAELTRVDSLLARIAPAIERAQRDEATRAPRLSQRHFWLGPNGDSIDVPPLPPDAPADARSAAAEREIRGHIARMTQQFATGDVRGARRELSTATGELTILRNFDTNTERTAGLQRELGETVRGLLVMCYRMRADSTLAPGVGCESFLAGLGRARDLRAPR